MAIHHLQEYFRPTELREALSLLRERGDAARPIGGGIDLARHTPSSVTALVDLTALPLAYVREEDDGVHLGATTTLTALERDPRLADYAGGVIPAMLHDVAAMQLRNLATIGGALAGGHPWSDVITVFLALGASVALLGDEERRVPLRELLASNGPGPGTLLTEAILPAEMRDARAAFVEFARSTFDVAMLNACCAVTIDGTTCAGGRVVLGGTPWIACELPEAGAALEGTTLDRESIAEIAGGAAAEARLGDDRRATAAYRKTLAEVGVRRCLQSIAGLAEGGPS